MNKDILVRLVLNASGLDSGLKNSKRSVDAFTEAQKGMAEAGKTVVAYLGKMAGGLGVAMGATEAFNKTVAATQTATDNMGRAMETAKVTVDKFFYSLATGDFEGFLQGLKDISKYAKAAYDALDDLGTFNIFKDSSIAEMNEQIEKLKTEIKSGKTYETGEDGAVTIRELSKTEVEARKKELEDETKRYIQLIQDTKQKELTAYDAVAKEILSGNNFKGTEAEMKAAADYYLKNYRSYDEATKRLEELNKQIAEKQTVEATYSAAGAGGIRVKTGERRADTVESMAIKQSAEYRNLMALQQIGDEPLRQMMQHRVNAAAAGSEMNRMIMGNERTIQRGGGGNGGGIKAVEGSVADLNKRLGEAQQQLDAMAFGTEAWEAQKAKVDELTDKVTALKSAIAAENVSKEAMQMNPFDMVNQAMDARNAIEIPVAIEPIDEEGWLGQDYSDQLHTLEENFGRMAEAMREKMGEVSDAVGATAGMFGALGDVVGGTTGDNIKAIGNLLQATEGMIPVIQSLMMVEQASALVSKEEATAGMMAAAAKAGKSVAGVPFAGPALAIAAITSILGMVSAIKSISFAEGGVMGGNNYADGINARISTGEVVFNQHDAKNLYDAVHSGNIGGGGGVARLESETIWIGLNNHLARTGQGRILLG